MKGPSVEGDVIDMGWRITYHKPGHPDFVLDGESQAELRKGMIVRLVDRYDIQQTHEALSAWVHATGVTLDPSYT